MVRSQLRSRGLELGWREDPFVNCPDDFRRRLKIVCNHIENGKLRAEGASPFHNVKLVDFSEWALSAMGWNRLPEQFPRKSSATSDIGAASGFSPLEERNGDTPDGTGLPGRRTSWHLIEPECRRRYAAKERHPGRAGESRAEWACTLITWLKATHPKAPVPKPKSVKN